MPGEIHVPPCIRKTLASLKSELDGFSCVIDNLKGVRDKYFAHLDKNYMNNLQSVLAEFPISSLYDLKALLDFASKFLNKVHLYLTGDNFTFSHERTHHLLESYYLKSFLIGLHEDKHDIWGNDINEEIRKIRFRQNPGL